ncbi:MAG: DUF1207 domain-containing protein [Elusimicrobiaceae bacterium]|nr:DUF1207 domain-containing protein [Elusimicrobiaceae bacterium]
MKKLFLLAAACCLTGQICRAAELLPPKKLFSPFAADLTQPAFAVRLTGVVGSNRLAEINMGDEFGIARWAAGRNRLQFGIMGGVAARFDISRVTNDFQVADFSLAFPIDYVADGWGLRATYWHTSSHVGDDYIISNGTLPAQLEKHVTDDFRLIGDYRPAAGLRLYGGLFYAFNIIPRTSDRWHAQCGMEGEKRIDSHAWFAAVNLAAHAKYGWQPSFNSRAGWKYYGAVSDAALFCEFFSGHLPYLALSDQTETHWSFGFSIAM